MNKKEELQVIDMESGIDMTDNMVKSRIFELQNYLKDCMALI
jgi:hypothetical protein